MNNALGFPQLIQNRSTAERKISWERAKVLQLYSCTRRCKQTHIHKVLVLIKSKSQCCLQHMAFTWKNLSSTKWNECSS